jgi:hypothetical protein
VVWCVGEGEERRGGSGRERGREWRGEERRKGSGGLEKRCDSMGVKGNGTGWCAACGEWCVVCVGVWRRGRGEGKGKGERAKGKEERVKKGRECVSE